MVDPTRSEGGNDKAAAYYCDNVLGPKTYDLIYGPHYAEAIKFYQACARKFGSPIIEIGCGTGLVTWALAKDGHQILGIDLSDRMLDIARKKKCDNTSSTNERIESLRADMSEFQLDRNFQMAIIPGRSFQHILTPDGQRATLTCIQRHLVPDGTLIMNLFDPKLDYCMPDAKPPVSVEESVDVESGYIVRRTILSRTTDPLTQNFTETMLLELLNHAGDTVSTEEVRWSLRWTYAQEMRYLLELTGFHVEKQYSDYEYGEPSYAKEQIWICQKL